MGHSPTTPDRQRPRFAGAGSIRLALGLNAALLGALLWTALDTRGFAQPTATGGPASIREPGRYTLVGGSLLTEGPNAIYVLDTLNHELVALDWDPGNRRVSPIGFRDLNVDRLLTPGR